MKTLMCVFLTLFTGCDPTDPFISFSPASNAGDGGGAPIISIDEDAGVAPDTGAGGTPGAGGVSSGGARVSGTGGHVVSGAGGRASGGVVSTGGIRVTGGAAGEANDAGNATDAGGAPDACRLITHTSGVGMTWQDCVPLGTHNEDQAMKACVAFTGDSKKCNRGPGCGTAPWVIQGADAAGTYDYIWGYEGNTAGYVGANGGCPNPAGQQWD